MDKAHEELLARIGSLTRTLRDSIRELGLDRAVAEAAQAIPDARDRLRYVAHMTEQAAVTVLNATEQAQPLQDEMSAKARELHQRLQDPAQAGSEALRAEIDDFLANVSKNSDLTISLLTDIMMAQGFQDLTGQVIMKMIDVIGTIEHELLQVLVDHVPPSQQVKREPEGLVNGPQINPTKPDVVTNQDQVDDLLASLGF